MNRFFVEPGSISGTAFAIPVTIAHQVRRVLRLGDGDELLLLDGRGSALRCRIEGDRLRVVERAAVVGEPRHRLTVCQALLKGDRLEQVIQHGTELGVARFRLVVTERCVVRELGARKLDRLRTIAREAAEQSERGCVPAVEAAVPLAATVAPGAALLAERSEGPRLGQIPPPASLIIGPEGGFTEAERQAAEAAGVTLAGLGPRILRSETVALAAAAVVLAATGDFA